MFEAGVFYTLLGIAFILLLYKFPYKEFLYWLSAGIFIYLGVVLFTSQTVVFKTSVTDGTNVINQTNYIIGDPALAYNINAMPFAYMLVVLGVVVGFIGLVMFASPPKKV
jgi:multisubunit Na+/H+ antiporter MnhB subunit